MPGPLTRRTPTRFAAVAGTAVAGLLLATGCTSAPEPPSDVRPSDVEPALRWGVYVPDDGSPDSDLDVVAAMAGDTPDYVLRFAAIGEEVPLARLTQIADRGMTPVLTLEPWVPGAGADQPAYAPARIAAGDHDAAVARWARELAAWDRPLLLRFAHEMNGDWYPWSIGRDGSGAAAYVEAFNRVHRIFDEAGADEVRFVWAPNIRNGSLPDFAPAYPGSASVDVLGLDGYNWGDQDGHRWRDPDEIFADSLAELRRLDPGLPVIVTETASAEGARLGADKAAWIGELVELLEASPGVVGFIWFQAQKERDWRLNSTAQAQEALRAALASRERSRTP